MPEQTNQNFLPVIIGTDLNAYTMAASFHDSYGIEPVLVGKIPMRFTEGTSFIQKIHYNDKLTEPKVFKEYLNEIASVYYNSYDSLILIGANDVYVNLIIDYQDELKDYFLFNYISKNLRDTLFYKKNFYDFCKQNGIDIPHTVYYNCANPGPIPTDFDFPMVVKPSDVVEYQEKGLHSINKLYFLDSQAELEYTINDIVEKGYENDLILQDFIPGDDTNMWDSVYYGDRNGKGQLITLAQVLLQERESYLVGAYTALVTRYNEAVMHKLATFLEDAGYTGFANFDLKLDPRDGRIKVFEVNIRQGRSSSYIDFAGHNMAEYIVEDLIYHKEKPMTYLKTDLLYSVVPNFAVKQFIDDEELKSEISNLIKQKKVANPLIYKGDKGFKRRMQMRLRRLNYYNKYRRYTKE